MAINFKVLPDCPPNVVYRYDDGGQVVPASALEAVRLSAPLTDVILPLARRHPDWRFETNQLIARHFHVSKGSEALGEILTTYRDYNTVAKVRNDKIRAAISKGDGMASKDAAKVRKLVEKYFVPRTDDERLAATWGALSACFNNLEYTARQTAKRKEGPIISSLMPTLLKQHKDTVLSVATSLSVTGLEELEEAYDHARLLKGFRVAAGLKGAGVVGVVRDGDKYWVQEAFLSAPLPPPATLYTDDTLPLQLRTNIGLLKLAQDGDAYDGVGVRCGPDLFLTVYNP
jgi:hypothetical protein